MSNDKQLHALDRIRRTRAVSMVVFGVVTLGVIGCAVLRDVGRLTPGLYGLVLTFWELAGLATVVLVCTVWLCEQHARYIRRTEQVDMKVEQLEEVVRVSEWMAMMEDDQDVRRSNGR